MRGKPGSGNDSFYMGGITPADAGKTKTEKGEKKKEQDHPRGCGENPTPDTQLEKLAGSPPRMRGKQKAPEYQYPKQRITPADAGKTQGCCRKCNHTVDHPRGCGENTKKIL